MASPQKYLELEMPERFEFQFWNEETQSWWGEAQYLAAHFNRLEDGSYVGTAGGSPIWFRCVEKLPDGSFIHIDRGGEGDRYRYRLLELPMIED